MRVNLLAHTPEPEIVVATAAKTCYSDKTIYEIFKDMQYRLDGQDIAAEIIRKCRDSGHLSVFEHVSFTFSIEEISRVCSHQLVRHRVASYSQRSQRYVDEHMFGVVIPESVRNDVNAISEYRSIIAQIRQAYEALLDLNIPKEDARYILPNACGTQIVMTMNARELLHFFRLRCCNKAQWEIRELANKMLEICRMVAPVLFEKAGAPCKTDGKCHEIKPCKENQKCNVTA